MARMRREKISTGIYKDTKGYLVRVARGQVTIRCESLEHAQKVREENLSKRIPRRKDKVKSIREGIGYFSHEELENREAVLRMITEAPRVVRDGVEVILLPDAEPQLSPVERRTAFHSWSDIEHNRRVAA